MELPKLKNDVSKYVTNNVTDYFNAGINSTGWGGATSTSPFGRLGFGHDKIIEYLEKEKEGMAEDKRRIVQVFIADTDPHIPLENAILYSGDQKLTDRTDEELFFELNIKELLDKHNDLRATIKDKELSSKDETVYMEPIRIRDLTMTVVTVTEF